MLYAAMKVNRYKISNRKTETFQVNDYTNKITRKQLEDGYFLQAAIDQCTAFIQGVRNAVHYWIERNKEACAIIRPLGKPTAFLTMSASEVHRDQLRRTYAFTG